MHDRPAIAWSADKMYPMIAVAKLLGSLDKGNRRTWREAIVSMTHPDQPKRHGTMSPTMVFCHPLPVPQNALSGSGVRPRRMLNAFREIGFEVEEITGYSRDRHRSARRLLDEIARGRRIDFAYAESATTPHALSDSHHYPRRPLLDARVFSSPAEARSARRALLP